jgi:DNA repair exonuclease SbcCD ATPase subunit
LILEMEEEEESLGTGQSDSNIVAEAKPADDDEMAFLQTQKALTEALNEQKILREKLTALETRNRPPKWGRPIAVQSIDATRGKFERDVDIPPEQLASELKTAQHMLENAKRASDAARSEKRHLENEIAQLEKTAKEETDLLLMSNAAHHKQDLQGEQQQFREELLRWTSEKSDFMAEAEQLSMTSHDVLHKSSEAKEFVDQQRKKIRRLADELRTDLTKVKELRDALDDAKAKVAMIETLREEISANQRSIETLEKHVKEQKQILKAVRVSAQAQAIMDRLAVQIKDLKESKQKAEDDLEKVTADLDGMLKNEERLKKELSDAQETYRREQLRAYAVESDLRVLRAEVARVKAGALEAGKRNVELHKGVRLEKMSATNRFVALNSRQIYQAEKLQGTLEALRDEIDGKKWCDLPPLSKSRRVKSAFE